MPSAKGKIHPAGLLAEYRWVYKHPTEGTRSEGRKKLQALFAEDFSKFMENWQKLEREYNYRGKKQAVRAEPAKVAASESTVQGCAVESDAGAERVMELLSEEWEVIRGILQERGLVS